MNNKYKRIIEVVKIDLEKVNDCLSFQTNISTRFKKILNDFLKSPSKRIRTLVSMLYMRAAKMYLLPIHYELFAAIELAHNISLIHDDVIDNSKQRRNKKSINEEFGNNLAVISGDYLLGVLLSKLVKIGKNDIIDDFAKTLQEMCIGEITQYFNRFIKTDIDTYIEKTKQKTASLFKCALKNAIVLADEIFTEKMEEFIVNFGIAFQIRNDLVNILSDLNTDEQDGIYNAPLIISDNIKEGIEKTKDLLNNYLDCAKHCLLDLEESIYKKALYELLELIGNV